MRPQAKCGCWNFALRKRRSYSTPSLFARIRSWTFCTCRIKPRLSFGNRSILMAMKTRKAWFHWFAVNLFLFTTGLKVAVVGSSWKFGCSSSFLLRSSKLRLTSSPFSMDFRSFLETCPVCGTGGRTFSSTTSSPSDKEAFWLLSESSDEDDDPGRGGVSARWRLLPFPFFEIFGALLIRGVTAARFSALDCRELYNIKYILLLSC